MVDLEAVAGAHTPKRGVLVVGMGDEQRGDGGAGVHLVGWLAQLDWPAGVVFCRADESIPKRSEQFARVILVDSIEGPEPPGSLYQADPAELLGQSSEDSSSGLGLLAMLSPAVRERLSIFGVQPKSTGWGSEMSGDLIASIPVVLPYLRAHILQAAADLMRLN